MDTSKVDFSFDHVLQLYKRLLLAVRKSSVAYYGGLILLEMVVMRIISLRFVNTPTSTKEEKKSFLQNTKIVVI